MPEKTRNIRNGTAAAAILAAGVGCFVTGVMTTGAEMSASLKTALTWSAAVGPLSGKTIVGVIAWLVAWVVFHFMWNDKDVDFRPTYYFALALVALGFLFTFPTFFGAFAAE